MVDTGLKKYEKVAEIIRNYYKNPDEVFNTARLGSKT